MGGGRGGNSGTSHIKQNKGKKKLAGVLVACHLIALTKSFKVRLHFSKSFFHICLRIYDMLFRQCLQGNMYAPYNQNTTNKFYTKLYLGGKKSFINHLTYFLLKKKKHSRNLVICIFPKSSTILYCQ